MLSQFVKFVLNFFNSKARILFLACVCSSMTCILLSYSVTLRFQLNMNFMGPAKNFNLNKVDFSWIKYESDASDSICRVMTTIHGIRILGYLVRVLYGSLF